MGGGQFLDFMGGDIELMGGPTSPPPLGKTLPPGFSTKLMWNILLFSQHFSVFPSSLFLHGIIDLPGSCF